MNSFGRIFRIHIFGESHGDYIGVCIDGVPPGIRIEESDFKADIERRKAGKPGTTLRTENDVPFIISGLYQNHTTGSPLTILFKNNHYISSDYDTIGYHFRPGHADFTSHVKYNGFADPRGGGHFSGRLTLPIVAAGVIAKKIITPLNIEAKIIYIDGNPNHNEAIEHALTLNDSVGGIVECKASPMPVGLGEPFFDSLESLIAHAMFSIPAVKGIEFGSGFKLAQMKGSEANDLFIDEKGTTRTNHHGGILGGISSGNELIFKIAVKPASSIPKVQQTYHWKEKKLKPLEIIGRHDVCIALRVPVVVESLTACVLADCMLLNQAYKEK